MNEWSGTRLILYRVRKKLTQAKLAKILGVSQSQVCRWEKGIHNPSKLRQVQINAKIPR